MKVGDWVEIKSWPDRMRGRVEVIEGPWVTVTFAKSTFHGDRTGKYKQTELEVIAKSRTKRQPTADGGHQSAVVRANGVSEHEVP